MTRELTEILLQIRDKITDESDLDWTSFTTAEELRKEIDHFIFQLDEGNKGVLDDVYVHFLPSSTFQEHAMQNDWTEEYMKLAERFDKIYASLRVDDLNPEP
mgnify:CR=1 FL=1|jgi:hypothetical protein